MKNWRAMIFSLYWDEVLLMQVPVSQISDARRRSRTQLMQIRVTFHRIKSKLPEF